jgi:hypothetical protein
VRHRGRIGCVAVGLLALVALAGCGGSDPTSTTATQANTSTTQSTTAATSEAAFLAAADKLCATGAKDLAKPFAARAKLTHQLATSPSVDGAKQMQDVLEQIAAGRAMTSSQLEGLDRPDSSSIDDYLAAREESTKDTQASADAFGAYAKHPNDATVAEITKAQSAEVKALDQEVNLAKQAGFKVCSSPAS